MRQYLYLSVFALGLGQHQVAAAGRPPAVLSREAISTSVIDAHKQLQTLLVEYVGTGRDVRTGGPQRSSSHHVVAYRGKCRFADNRHFSSVWPRELDLDHTRYYFSPSAFGIYYPHAGSYDVHQKDPWGAYYRVTGGEFFTECVGWWPPDDERRPPGRPFFLAHALRQDGYRVLPEQEQVDGTWCHVLELAGVDKLWIDCSEGFFVRRREWYVGTPPTLSHRYELSDYRETSPGMWLPRKARRVAYDFMRSRGETIAPLLQDGECTVVRVEVNNVGPEVFEFRPPPGTLVEDRDTGSARQVPGGLSLLDSAISTASARAAIYRSLEETDASSWVAAVREGGAISAIVFLLVLDFYLLRTALRGLARRRGHSTMGCAGG